MTMAGRRGRSVRSVLLATHLAVIAVVAAVGFVTVRLLTPELFDRRMRVGAGTGLGSGRGPAAGPGPTVDPFADATAVSESLDRSLTIGAAVAAVAGIVVALAVAWFAGRVLVRRVEAMRAATGRLADGELDVRVEVPPEAELADLAVSINRLGASLAATERTRARMISDLAHELRNPLTTIQGSMEGLIDGVLSPTPETLTSVAEEADRLRRLTEDLSVLARGSEGAIELRIETVDLLDLVDQVADRWRTRFDLAGVELRTGGSAVAVAGDRDRLTQVLANVVGNALTHTPAGGVVAILVEPTPGPGTGDGGAPGGRITVTDTGSGIAPEDLETVFGRYTRLDHQHPGTGIGLNIARTLVRAHGGTIEARSDGPGTGTAFVVELPAGRPPAP